ncbi:LssY C-terminal domain-containing protein [Nocardioides panacis]|uniref:LssY C-terminal domain-containing protein n=1 Tax=Nocardioides panacis TaxID=2849501 RepID=UPI0020B36515|nr:LssY C-terminal domain-containing protein [Nocardioides panacis]
MNFSTGYHSHNGGGDRIETDGDLPVLELARVEAPPRPPAPLPPPILRAPPPTVFGAAVAAGRGLLSLAVAGLVAVSGDASGLVGSDATAATVTATVLAFAAVGLLDLWLARAVVRGSTAARVLLLLLSTVFILDTAVSNLSGGPRPTLGNGLPAVTLSILLMLALSSTRAREYAAARGPATRTPVTRTQPSPGS